MVASRPLALTALLFTFVLTACGEMHAEKTFEKSSLGAEGNPGEGGEPPVPPAPTPNDSPFDKIVPDRELWVATYGNDDDPGTLFKPKRSISAALYIATPGTSIMVKAGSYKDYLLFAEPGGTRSKPIWIRSADGRGAATITGLFSDRATVRFLGVENIQIEGFTINGGVEINAGTGSNNYAQYVVVQNNIVSTGSTRDGIAVNASRYIYVLSNVINTSQDPVAVGTCTGCVIKSNTQ
jgi:hypothetical protein